MPKVKYIAIVAIKTYNQKDMGSSSNFNKLLMWTCTNKQLVSYIELAYTIVYTIATIT